MAQARPQTMGGPASDVVAALATELIQYIQNAQTRYIEGVDAGDPPTSKNAREAALATEVAAKIRQAIYGNAPVAHPNAKE